MAACVVYFGGNLPPASLTTGGKFVADVTAIKVNLGKDMSINRQHQ
jgi:hypothetical protein